MSAVDDWFSRATGSYLLTCDPLAGTASFFGAVAERRDGETLLVTTARSGERIPPTALASAAGVVDATPRETAAATNVGSPADLTGISVPVTEFLRRADEPAVAFDSVSPLLYYAEVAAVRRFLVVLAGHVARYDGVGVFALSPAAHGPDAFEACADVFDGQIELEESKLEESSDIPRARVQIDSEGAPGGWQAL